MNIAAEFNDNICVLRPQGRIDTLTDPEVETAVTENAAKCGRLVLDMAEVDYVSSAGIRVIVRAYQERVEERHAASENDRLRQGALL